jgi:hypothetical protein
MRLVKQRGGESKWMQVQLLCESTSSANRKISPPPSIDDANAARWLSAAPMAAASAGSVTMSTSSTKTAAATEGAEVEEVAGPARSSAAPLPVAGESWAVDEFVCKRLTHCTLRDPEQIRRWTVMKQKIDAVVAATFARMEAQQSARRHANNRPTSTFAADATTVTALDGPAPPTPLSTAAAAFAAVSSSVASTAAPVSFRYCVTDDELFDYRVSWSDCPSNDDTWQSFASIQQAWQTTDEWTRALVPLEQIFTRMQPEHPPAHETVTIE